MDYHEITDPELIKARVKGLSRKLGWHVFKLKLVSLIGLNWCDWCDTLCYSPTITEHDESVCRHCVEDAINCECCENLVHPDYSVDMPEGWYCQDCWDATYG